MKAKTVKFFLCKALDKGIEIREILLQKKSGGKSGDYQRPKKR